MTKLNPMPISDASEPYDIATRSPDYSGSQRWSEQQTQRETRALLYELARLERDAADACTAVLHRIEGARQRRDGHLERAREHTLRADQLVEMALDSPPLDARVPHPPSELAACHNETAALELMDANDRAIEAAVQRALRSTHVLPSERERLRHLVEPFVVSLD